MKILRYSVVPEGLAQSPHLLDLAEQYNELVKKMHSAHLAIGKEIGGVPRAKICQALDRLFDYRQTVRNYFQESEEVLAGNAHAMATSLMLEQFHGIPSKLTINEKLILEDPRGFMRANFGSYHGAQAQFGRDMQKYGVSTARHEYVSFAVTNEPRGHSLCAGERKLYIYRKLLQGYGHGAFNGTVTWIRQNKPLWLGHTIQRPMSAIR